jgi:LysM repeat protein
VPDLKCYACEREPTQQCARCGRPYCDDHGEDFCNVCLEPSSGVPSFNLYRGSLLALFVGAALAIWLIIQPSSNTSGSALPRIITPTAAAATGNLTTPAPNTGSPQTQPTAAGTARPATTSTAATPAAGATSAPTASTSTAGGTNGDYVVVSGDTLSSICSDKIRKPPTLSTSDCVTQVMSLNNLTSDVLSVGQHLKVPQ